MKVITPMYINFLTHLVNFPWTTQIYDQCGSEGAEHYYPEVLIKRPDDTELSHKRSRS